MRGVPDNRYLADLHICSISLTILLPFVLLPFAAIAAVLQNMRRFPLLSSVRYTAYSTILLPALHEERVKSFMRVEPP